MNSITLIVFLPLLAAIVAGFGNRIIGNVPAKVITTGALFAACALSWPIFIGFVSGTSSAEVVPVMTWIISGDLNFDWSLRVDTLTAVMLVVVTTVSALVHLYSWGYMDEDPDQPRFFAYLSLFTFAMLMLVTANNLVQMFFGWEGVGLASYLLIGFWFKKPSANAAAIKAFVVNRVGDLGFMLGIFATFLVFGTVSIPEILEAAPGMAGSTITFAGMRLDTMTIICLLLFIGAMGKSAQLGLHTWLPDAMEGPTPVSALIHAATMVTAGVFMVCRLSPMFETSDVALTVVTVVGACTAIFAATVGLVQNDIKRVIAYSTCSQLGYMFFAAGVGAYNVAMFHLFTHAFFKALLFLGAGSVIHAMHHEQDKDAIIEAAFASGSQVGQFAFFIGVLAALLTSFYSWRLMFLTFWGKPRWIQSEHIQHSVHKTPEQAGDDTTGGYHPHESPLTMLVPLGVLSVGAVFAGFVFSHAFIDDGGFWNGAIAYDAGLMHAMHEVPLWVKLSATAAMLSGLATAYFMYFRGTDRPARLAATFSPLYAFFFNKWYFEELYDRIFIRPAFWFGRLFWKKGDEGTIDRFGPNGIASVIASGSGVMKRFQSGYLYTYALVMLLGLAAAATWIIVQGAS